MKQKTRWSENQLTSLKGSFADNDLAITAIRKVLLEDTMTENEEAALQMALRDKKDIQELVWRHYCPELVVDAPIGQVQDRLTGIQTETLSPEMATFQAAATEKAEACMKSHITELCGGAPGMSFKSLYKLDLDDPVGTYIGLMARNKYIVDAERLTHHLALLAGKKEETPEETMNRLQQNSSK